MTVVDVKAAALSPTALDQLVILHELAAVVGGDRPELLPEARRLTLHSVYGPAYGLRPSVRQLDDDLLSAQSLRQCEKYTSSILTADHQVHFPMSILFASVNVRRSDLYAGQLRVYYPLPLVLGFLGPLLPLLPQNQNSQGYLTG